MAAEVLTPGTCRVCGCGGQRFCAILSPSLGGIVTCEWFDDTETLCTNVGCLVTAGVLEAPEGFEAPAAAPRIVLP